MPMSSIDATGNSEMNNSAPVFGAITYDEVVRFHGHTCPGLAYGWRMTVTALQALDIRERARDEELVAIVENDACGVDAVQYLTGCTFGKGNLIFRDWGKMAYTLIRRDTGAGVRVRIRSGEKHREMSREERRRWILTGPVEEILVCDPVKPVIPATAAAMPSVTCVRCGERTMETRTVAAENGPLCIPCAHVVMPGGVSMPSLKSERIIRTLDLNPLPEEDGLFNEVYRAEETLPVDALPERYSGNRSIATSIYYMLTPGIVSRMHRVASDEIFHLLAGGPVRMLQLGHDTGESREIVLGMDLEAGQRPMAVVPAGIWQGMALMPGAAFALFGCTVAPGFAFDDFELGHRDTLIQNWPAFADKIKQLTQ